MTDNAKDTEKDANSQEDARPEDVEELVGQLGGPTDVRISVHRYDRAGGREFVETIPAPFEGDVLEDIRERFGGGRFWLQFRKDRAIRANRTVRIAGKPKPLPSELLEEEEEGPDPDASEEDRVAELERRLEEKENELRDRDIKDLVGGLARELQDIRDQLRNPPAAAERTNPAELAMSIVGMLQQQTQPYLEVLLERKPPEPQAEKMMELFMAGMDAARDMENAEGYRGVLRDLGKPLVNILDRMAPETGASTFSKDGQPMVPSPQQAASWQQLFQPFIPHILKWAQQGMNPKLRAALVAEEIPTQYLDVVGSAIHRPGFLEEFVATVPGAAEHRPWLSMFLGQLREEIVLEDPEPQGDQGQDSSPEQEAGVEIGTGTPPGEDD